MRGRIRDDILEYLKAQQYVSEYDALDHAQQLTYEDLDEDQFEADFDVTLNYFIERVEQIEGLQ